LAPSLALLGSAFLWGTLWIPLRQLKGAGVSSASATTVGFLLPLLLLLPLALRRRRSILASDRTLAAAGFLMALSIALYAEGLVRGQVARVILLFYLTPVWSTLLARLMLGEPITGRRIITIILGLTGMVVIFRSDAVIPSAGLAAEGMGLTAGVVWGLAMVYVNRTASRPLLDRVFVQFVFLGPVFFLVTLIPGSTSGVSVEARALLASAHWWVPLAAIWMLPVIGLTIFGAGRLEPGRVAIFLMLEIAVGLTTAALLTDEPLGPRELGGAILIMGATGVEMGPRRPRPTASPRR
jgi:drug/metabolite transporter (DMT)-like permease